MHNEGASNLPQAKAESTHCLIDHSFHIANPEHGDTCYYQSDRLVFVGFRALCKFFETLSALDTAIVMITRIRLITIVALSRPPRIRLSHLRDGQRNIHLERAEYYVRHKPNC